ncbi:MAG: type II secretion system protein GspD [Candidatus Omnitrophota bacterium]|nr:MAG: type II secretion system protein GspD [Candidatus Omnitrophota bacterium]
MSCIFRRPKTHKTIFIIAFSIIIVCILPVVSFTQEKDVSNPAKISLDVKGMDIIDVLKILSDEGKFNLSIGGNVTGRVTLFLKDIDVWDALEIVLISANLAYEKKGDIIYIMTERDYELKYGQKYWDKREVEIFNLKNAKASRVRELFSQAASNIGKVIIDEPTNTVVVTDTPDKLVHMRKIVEKVDRLLATEVFELNYLSAEDLEQKLKDILTAEVGTMRFDAASNKAVIIDYPEKLEKIREVVGAFDVKPLQVLIDAKIIELSPSKKFYSGISWDYWIQKYFKTSGTFSFPSTSTDKITFGTHDSVTTEEKGDYSSIMEFLNIFGNTKVLSTPRILVLNNQEAKILVGTKDAYITSTVSELGESAVTSQSVNFVDIGVKLYVTPTINRKGYVTLKIRPEISSSTRTNITSEGQITQIPIVTTSEAETTLMVKEGVSVLLGGLRKITHTKQKKQVPILGSIPLVGSFFRSKKDEWSKDELVIVLTPRIVSGDRSIEAEIHDKLVGEIWETEAIDEFRKEEREDIDINRRLGELDEELSYQEGQGERLYEIEKNKAEVAERNLIEMEKMIDAKIEKLQEEYKAADIIDEESFDVADINGQGYIEEAEPSIPTPEVKKKSPPRK